MSKLTKFEALQLAANKSGRSLVAHQHLCRVELAQFGYDLIAWVFSLAGCYLIDVVDGAPCVSSYFSRSESCIFKFFNKFRWFHLSYLKLFYSCIISTKVLNTQAPNNNSILVLLY